MYILIIFYVLLCHHKSSPQNISQICYQDIDSDIPATINLSKPYKCLMIIFSYYFFSRTPFLLVVNIYFKTLLYIASVLFCFNFLPV